MPNLDANLNNILRFNIDQGHAPSDYIMLDETDDVQHPNTFVEQPNVSSIPETSDSIELIAPCSPQPMNIYSNPSSPVRRSTRISRLPKYLDMCQHNLTQSHQQYSSTNYPIADYFNAIYLSPLNDVKEPICYTNAMS